MQIIVLGVHIHPCRGNEPLKEGYAIQGCRLLSYVRSSGGVC